MKKSSWTMLGASVTASLVLGGSLTAAHASPSEPMPAVSAERSAGHSAEDVFRGVVFGQGDVGRILTDLVPSADKSSDVKHEIDRIVADVTAHEDGFLSSFARSMQSGDVVRVQDAVNEAATVLNGSLARLGYVDAAENGSISPQCITVTLFAAAALVYALGAVLQITLVATYNIYANKTKVTSRSTSSSDLSHDTWLAEVTTALAR